MGLCNLEAFGGGGSSSIVASIDHLLHAVGRRQKGSDRWWWNVYV